MECIELLMSCLPLPTAYVQVQQMSEEHQSLFEKVKEKITQRIPTIKLARIACGFSLLIVSNKVMRKRASKCNRDRVGATKSL